jgi:hypothetical protein
MMMMTTFCSYSATVGCGSMWFGRQLSLFSRHLRLHIFPEAEGIRYCVAPDNRLQDYAIP